MPSAERLDRAALSAMQGRRLSQLLAAIHGRNAFLHAQARRRRHSDRRAAVSRRPVDAAADDEGRTDRRPGREPARGARRSPSRSSTTRGTARRRRRPAARCAGSTRTRAGSGCSNAGRRSIAAPASDPATACSSRFRSGRFSGSGPDSTPAVSSGFTACPAAGCPASSGSRMIDAVGATVVCCTPTYALRLAEVAARAGRMRPLAESSVRVLIVAGEPGGSIPATRERIEAQLGRARHRPSRPDRSRADQLRVLGGARISPPQRRRVHRAKCSIRRQRRAVADGAAGRTGRHEPGPDGQPGHPVPHRRHRRPALGAVPCGRTWARLEGGILARADDMVNIRGVNVYPAASSRWCAVFRGRRVPVDRVADRRDALADASRSRWSRRPATVRRLRARVSQQLARGARTDGAGHGRRARHAAAVRDEGPPIRRGGVVHGCPWQGRTIPTSS